MLKINLIFQNAIFGAPLCIALDVVEIYKFLSSFYKAKLSVMGVKWWTALADSLDATRLPRFTPDVLEASSPGAAESGLRPGER